MQMNRLPVFANLKSFLDRADVTGFCGIPSRVLQMVTVPKPYDIRYDHIILEEQTLDGVQLPLLVLEAMWRGPKICNFWLTKIEITPAAGAYLPKYKYSVGYSEPKCDLNSYHDWLALAWVVRTSALPKEEREEIIKQLRADA